MKSFSDQALRGQRSFIEQEEASIVELDQPQREW